MIFTSISKLENRIHSYTVLSWPVWRRKIFCLFHEFLVWNFCNAFLYHWKSCWWWIHWKM